MMRTCSRMLPARLLHVNFAILMTLSWVYAVNAAPLQLYVAPNGNDAWSGQLEAPNADQSDGPLATLAGARDVLRANRKADRLPEGAIVTVGEGNYVFTETLKLTADDAGTEQAPVIVQAEKGKQVRLLGGRIIEQWKRVADEDVLKRLAPAARGQLMMANLKALGINDYGNPAANGIELFFNNRAMTLARWPNTGFAKLTDVLGKTEVNVRGTKGTVEGIFRYDGERPQRWTSEQDAWVHGYWFWDWSDQRHRIKTINVDQQTIEVQPPYHGYGYRKGQWFYGFNLLSEIDQPGEWYVDREQGILYFWPPSAVEQGEVLASNIPTLITLDNVSHFKLTGFTLEGIRGTAVIIKGGTENRIAGCTIRNVGAWAAIISGGIAHGVVGCDMYQMGGGGISLSGGNRTTLTPAGHFAENNHIHHYARVKRVYQPGITLRGVGNRATHNLIHNAPHMGMGFSGNDHVIELNEIHSVCYESNDAGAIYSGRNWTMRGTVVRNNYLHHITGFEGRGCVGVYLDDMFCGTEISGNLFYRVTRAAFVGGGRDCIVKNNLFVDCKPALHIDARALGWAHDHSDKWIAEGKEKGTLSGIAYTKLPYLNRYPGLDNILKEEPAAPRGNRVYRNVSVGGKWDEIYNKARKYVAIENNFVDGDPLFVTPERLKAGQHPRPSDFELKPSSPVLKIGFEPLPLNKIGLYNDESRASWPVVSQVRAN